MHKNHEIYIVFIPQLENEQQKILMVLTMRKKEFEVIDIMKPGNQVHLSTLIVKHCENFKSESPNLHARSRTILKIVKIVNI